MKVFAVHFSTFLMAAVIVLSASFQAAFGATSATSISSLSPAGPAADSEASASILKIEQPESELMTVIRDAGVGFGVGTIAGIGFILLSSGKFPSDHANFDTQALTSGMLVGLGGGIVTGLWEVKRDRALRVSIAPPAASGASPTVGVTKSF